MADEKHHHCFTAKGYLLTIVYGHLLWRLSDTEYASAGSIEVHKPILHDPQGGVY